MTFHLHRAERTDLLADGLADLLSTGPVGDDPFATETVVVSAVGAERWLSQRLSHRLGAQAGHEDGVSAGIRFVRPRSIVAELLGIDDTDPWRPEALTWSVLTVLDRSLDEPWLAAVARHLGHGHVGVERELREGRRLTVARHLAERFHAYAMARPDMTATWTAGLDEDGTGRPLDPDVTWQAEMWRRVRPTVDAPSPDERIAATVLALSGGPDHDLRLPDRVSLFGHNRLPLGELRVLAALAAHRDVHLWLPHHSPAAWQTLTPVLSAAAPGSGVLARIDDTSAEHIANRLSAALGRDMRELHRSLATVAPAAVDHVAESLPRPNTLLGRVQADIVADRPGEPADLKPDDRTIQTHACHGRTRQVEVLRDVIVGLLQDDPTLEPRDFVVMVPDIETFAPLFQAAFGLADVIEGPHHPGHLLRVMLADRALTRTNPLLALAVDLLSLAHRGRLTNAEVLDVLGAEPVRERFGLDDDAIERATAWIDSTAIRWGLDADHRRRFGVPLDQNTWRAGIDRLIAGVVATEDPARPVGDVLPLDDVPSGDVDLVGRLATFVDRLGAAVDAFDGEHTMLGWGRAIGAAVTDLAEVAPSDAWQRQQFDLELEQFTDDLTALRRDEVLALLRDRWAGRPSRASFRTGSLTVCTMVPMRSVPHRVVCLVGLDDGVFPRSPHVDGDDVLARRPLTGERDGRSEDRQLLLDAVMSATEHLVITYTGADENRGQARPPAVPLGELLDQVRRTAGRDDVVTAHPLQPFDPRNLRPGALVPDGRPFSFDRSALAGARASVRSRREPGPLLSSPLPDVREEEIRLADLVSFVQNPIRGFWRQRLGVTLRSDADLLDEDLPITLNGLDRWAIGQRLLDAAVHGVDPGDAWDGIRRAGLLPPGALATAVVDAVGPRVVALVGGTAGLRSTEAESIDVDVALPDGRRLTGTIEGVHDDRIVTVTYSTVRAKHRLADWVRHLALAAQRPDVAWTTHTAGKLGSGTAQMITGPLSHDEGAVSLLADLVDLRDAGLTRPLPLPIETSLAFATTLRSNGRDAAARRAEVPWSRDRFSPEAEADEVVRTFGAHTTYETLREAGFETLAPRLWDGALDHQRQAAL